MSKYNFMASRRLGNRSYSVVRETVKIERIWKIVMSPVSADLRSEAVLQVDSVINTAGSNNAPPNMQGVSGGSGCTTSVCNYVNIVINQATNSCSYGSVNVTSEIYAKSSELCELTLPTFTTVQSKFLFASLGTLASTSVSHRYLTNCAYL